MQDVFMFYEQELCLMYGNTELMVVGFPLKQLVSCKPSCTSSYLWDPENES